MKKILCALLFVALFAGASLACVGKNLVIGTDSTPKSKAVAQILAILINERTGTTIEVRDFASPDALAKEIKDGDVDLALSYAGQALKKAGKPVPADGPATLAAAKSFYMEEQNLVLLTAFGFGEDGNPASPAAPLAQKHALKKFPALPRLIAKTENVITEEVIKDLTKGENYSKAARDFLVKNKLI